MNSRRQQVLKKTNNSKYTPDYYRNLKEENSLRWKEVPFTCHNCGKIFHVEKVKPKSLPVNCSTKCRNDSFNPGIGGNDTSRLEDLNWEKVNMLIEAGKSGPIISEAMKISLVSLHKHVKKRLGVVVLNKMIRSGKKNRKKAAIAACTKK